MAIEEQTNLERAPDPADEAAQISQLSVSVTVADIRARLASAGISRDDCAKCGVDIPVARQIAVSGVQHCRPCAELIDLKAKGVRRV